MTKNQVRGKAQELREISEIIEERSRIEGGYKYYVPSVKGEQMIKDFGNAEKFIYFISAANGFGKTRMMATMLASVVFENVNDYFKGVKMFDTEYWDELHHTFGTPRRARIICPKATTTPICRELHHAFPEGRYTTRRDGYSYESRWETDTGWTISVMTSDQSPKQFESETLGLLLFDEVPPEAIYDGCVMRMRNGGHILITATPIAGAGYLYDKFVSGSKETEITDDDGESRMVERSVGYMTATIFEAEIGKKHRGHLSRKKIEDIVAETTGVYQKARVYGQFNQLSGSIFKTFSPLVHVITPFTLDERAWSVTNLFDPHPSHPNAVLWVAQNENNELLVVDELFMEVFSIEEFVEKIKSMDKHYRVTDWVIDSAAAKSDQNTSGTAPIEMYNNLGLPYVAGPKKSVMQGIELMRGSLSFVGSPENPTSLPRLRIFDRCPVIIRELKNYRWKEERDGHTGDSRPIDKDDHMIENLRRFHLLNPTFRRLVEKRRKPLVEIANERVNQFQPYSL